MIQDFVRRFDAGRVRLREQFSREHPKSYEDIVQAVVEVLNPGKDYDLPDPERITVINHGDYQGTLVFVVAEVGYQPGTYWFVKVSYGSCSGCDTLERIRDYAWGDERPTEDQVNQYMTLALHIVQGLRTMDGWA